jgi:hypothetical protein
MYDEDKIKAQQKARQKAYYEANKLKILTQQKAYKEANKDKIKAQQKVYKKANKDKIKAQQELRICKVCKLEYPGNEMIGDICYLCKEEE